MGRPDGALLPPRHASTERMAQYRAQYIVPPTTDPPFVFDPRILHVVTDDMRSMEEATMFVFVVIVRQDKGRARRRRRGISSGIVRTVVPFVFRALVIIANVV